ncbi:fumarylacetoacetate hydrolase family protein [Flavimaricola marinus]|uniref:Fumarylpyruvate hydrolase n=1 Tax=Flavimaricola marinus TaxID=1819565 RepID=A0A238LKI0_9RHOB|nr:fumarylacetoacetate hydrolase family protein [Flavimaricola marinus]SMY09895.1 Fumarylpyruvate hydrolase [Flavimaricola marinus]
MPDYVFPPRPQPILPVVGQTAVYPVGRIFCVGRNYAAHAAEMGQEVDREKPFYFTKSCHATVLSGAVTPYPPGTDDFHFEMELAVAIGASAFRINKDRAMEVVFGYACALDMTRRDLQLSERKKQRPWDLGKDVENAAVFGPLTPAEAFGDIGAQRIWLQQNAETRQDATLAEMVWSVPEIIAHLSGFYHLVPGDLIMTGTPAGVGPVSPGDVLDGGIDGLEPLRLTIGDPA